MKMISSTSITSTSGTTLISESDDETRIARPRRGPPPLPPVSCTFGKSSIPYPGSRIPATRDPRTLRKIPLRNIQELEREIIHVRREVLHAVREVVVEVHRRDGREEPCRRGNQRLR